MEFETDLFAEVGKALANPTRFELLHLLAQGERSVEALAATASTGVTTVSAHLQQLRRAGLVLRRRDGHRMLYRIASDDVLELMVAVQAVAHRHAAGVVLARGHGEDDEVVRSVAWDELAVQARSGEVVVLDVRPEDEFAAGHFPDAVSIPLSELEARMDDLPADRPIVAYCRGRYCMLSHDAVRLLRERGFDAAVLDGGVLEWRADGRPVGAGA
jgi:rhodanese-related sulfurtransferase/DNA-binding transcriptional ArsR family regulator